MGEEDKQAEVQTPVPAVTEAPPVDEKAVDPASPVEKLADEAKALAVVESKRKLIAFFPPALGGFFSVELKKKAKLILFFDVFGRSGGELARLVSMEKNC